LYRHARVGRHGRHVSSSGTTSIAPVVLVHGGIDLFEVSRSIAQIAGPGLAGVLVQAITAPFAIALGSLIGGLLAEQIGLRPTLLVGTLGGLTSFLWLFFSPVRTLREQPRPV
jgi:predicted MFS family arabinose efflux permease